ncbi:DMT family transporter [Kingella negevensis]|uniref:DMT family transporter n=1 Tax=Kingella negevensis TaxID=1522312 RepID=UPI00255129CA|nr:DMT family transporter [Kingella negevensis]MDK4680499.1 DMT family transporter [Kingella negevensis]MDK4681778.1 DMT family transporter [Kingella negevensis]MDK4689975.1 DMT family transporter [Kingella negevensis]MDK4692680.1 DMT family transporter [Kingella negevensis]MDK4698979.1 DMT family transporter [Kingella negevensis]
MVFLIISILASVSVSILLKTMRRNQIQLAQSVAINYIIAATLSALFLSPNLSNWQQTLLPKSWLFVLLGVLFPSVFIIMGRAVESTGIVKSDAAQRLSLFLPVFAAFTFFGETLTTHRVIGLLLAIAALVCILNKPSQHTSSSLKTQIQLLLGVWLGYGTIDILLKQLSKEAGIGSNLLVTFVLAGIFMFSYLLIKKARWTRYDLIGGIALGSLNFINILFYLKAHKAFSSNPTLVFAGMNMGVIALGTLVGAILFREKISKLNAVGIALAFAAITCLFYGANLFT